MLLLLPLVFEAFHVWFYFFFTILFFCRRCYWIFFSSACSILLLFFFLLFILNSFIAFKSLCVLVWSLAMLKHAANVENVCVSFLFMKRVIQIRTYLNDYFGDFSCTFLSLYLLHTYSLFFSACMRPMLYNFK